MSDKKKMTFKEAITCIITNSYISQNDLAQGVPEHEAKRLTLDPAWHIIEAIGRRFPNTVAAPTTKVDRVTAEGWSLTDIVNQLCFCAFKDNKGHTLTKNIGFMELIAIARKHPEFNRDTVVAPTVPQEEPLPVDLMVCCFECKEPHQLTDMKEVDGCLVCSYCADPANKPKMVADFKHNPDNVTVMHNPAVVEYPRQLIDEVREELKIIQTTQWLQHHAPVHLVTGGHGFGKKFNTMLLSIIARLKP